MTITAIKPQSRQESRVSIFVDGKYSFSLSIGQLADFKLKVGQAITDSELTFYKEQSQRIKLYRKAVNYCLLRQRSVKEVTDYLSRKLKQYQQEGLLLLTDTTNIIEGVVCDLEKAGYLNDLGFAKAWLEGRFYRKGISRRRLVLELKKKGVAESDIEEALANTERNDQEELIKVIARKRKAYPDREKLIRYLQRLGFAYSDIVAVLENDD